MVPIVNVIGNVKTPKRPHAADKVLTLLHSSAILALPITCMRPPPISDS